MKISPMGFGCKKKCKKARYQDIIIKNNYIGIIP